MPNNKFVLLTGAGFTKNFGGFLADEMWAHIFNHRDIQKSEGLRSLMIGQFNYEEIYYGVLNNSSFYDDIDKNAIKHALMAAYASQEANYSGPNASFHLEGRIINDLCDFVSSNASHFFTLNQDLFLEKILRVRLPFLSLPLTPTNLDDPEARNRLPSNNISLSHLKSSLDLNHPNYFKLHGSINWLDSETGNVLVIVGGDKIDQIEKEPLLKSYYDYFKEILLLPNQNLLTIGYGFMDTHINRAIAEGIHCKNLKIHIIDTLKPRHFSQKMKEVDFQRPYLTKIEDKHKKEITLRKEIWNNVSGYFPINSIFDFFSKDGPTPYLNLLKNNL